MVRALSQVEIDRLAASGRSELAKERDGALLGGPVLRNTSLAINLDGDDTITCRMGVFAVPPVPWDLGATLLEIQTRLVGAANRPDSTVAEYRAIVGQAVQLFPRLVRRRFARFRPNPFRKATGPEVGQLLGFFFACQTKHSPVVPSGHDRADRPSRSTSRSG